MSDSEGVYYIWWITPEAETRLKGTAGPRWWVFVDGEDVGGHDVGKDLKDAKQAAEAKAIEVGAIVELWFDPENPRNDVPIFVRRYFPSE